MRSAVYKKSEKIVSGKSDFFYKVGTPYYLYFILSVPKSSEELVYVFLQDFV